MSSSHFQPKSILGALLVSYLLSGILLLILSLAVWKLQLSEQTTGTLVFAVYLLSCFAGGFISARLIRSRRFFWGLLTGLLYVLVLTALSWIFGEDVRSFDYLIPIVICCAFSGMIGGIAG